MKLNIKILSFLILFSCNSFAQVGGVFLDQAVISQNAKSLILCDTVSSFPVNDTWPDGIAWDGLFLWCSGYNSQYVHKYSTEGLIIDSIPNPGGAHYGGGMTFDGTSLWFLSEQENIIYKVDTNNGLIIKQFDVPLDANGFGITFDGPDLLATSYISGDFLTIDTANGEIINSLVMPKPVMAIEMINDTLYGIQKFSSQLYKIDKNSGLIIDSMYWCIPYPLDIAWDGEFLWNISSNISYGGNQRAYKVNFGSLFTSTDNLPIEDNIDLIIFPNPAYMSLNIKANNILYGSEYSVISFTGQVLLTGTIVDKYTYIDLGHFKNGIYLFRTENTTKIFIKGK